MARCSSAAAILIVHCNMQKCALLICDGVQYNAQIETFSLFFRILVHKIAVIRGKKTSP